jgi:hypothetical protein
MNQRIAFLVAVLSFAPGIVAAEEPRTLPGTSATEHPSACAQVKHEPLTGKIREVLQQAAVVVVTDFQGNVTVFESDGTRDATYPFASNKVGKPYVFTLQAFEGSDCIDYIDSLGYARRVCRP